MNVYQLKTPYPGVIRLSDNASIPEDNENRDWIEYMAWVHAGNTPEPSVINNIVVTKPNNSVVSKEVFWALFTPKEQAGIIAAAMSNAAVGAWFQIIQSHEQIDLTDSLTSQGLDALISASLLTLARKTAILTPAS